jgi:hypothetical protein
MVKKTAPLPPKLVAVKDQPSSAADAPTPDLAAGGESVTGTPAAAIVAAPAKRAKAAKAPAKKAAPKAEAKPPSKPASKPAKAEKPAKADKAEKPDKAAKKPLNFKVPAEFRREFKTYASTHDLKLNRLLELAFESYRKQRGD